MPTKYIKPVDLDEVTEDLAVVENVADEPEPEESDWIFGPVRKPVTWEQRDQPQNEARTEPFRVGEPHGGVFRERWALPPFRYPAPGEPLTAEIAEAALRYSNLRARANQALNDLVMYYKFRVWRGGVETSNEVGVAERERIRSENRSFLEGVLKSHGLDVPTDEQIEKWAEEDLKNAAH
jgi:hypothetical protein